jgi:hypothetical protein
MAALFMLLSATLAFMSSSSDKALENASKAIKMREEARKLSPKDKKAATGKDAPQSSSSSSTSTEATTGAADTTEKAEQPATDIPVENAPTPAPAAPAPKQ